MASHAEGPSAGSALPPTLSSAKEPHGQQASPGAASHPLEWEEEAASPSSDLASARATPSPVPTGRGGGGGGGEGSPNPGMALQLLQLQCVLEAKDREMSCLRQQISSDQAVQAAEREVGELRAQRARLEAELAQAREEAAALRAGTGPGQAGEVTKGNGPSAQPNVGRPLSAVDRGSSAEELQALQARLERLRAGAAAATSSTAPAPAAATAPSASPAPAPAAVPSLPPPAPPPQQPQQGAAGSGAESSSGRSGGAAAVGTGPPVGLDPTAFVEKLRGLVKQIVQEVHAASPPPTHQQQQGGRQQQPPLPSPQPAPAGGAGGAQQQNGHPPAPPRPFVAPHASTTTAGGLQITITGLPEAAAAAPAAAASGDGTGGLGTAAAPPAGSCPPVLELNVDGTGVFCDVRVLEQVRGSRLYSLLVEGYQGLPRDSQGRPYLSYNPQVFQALLSLLKERFLFDGADAGPDAGQLGPLDWPVVARSLGVSREYVERMAGHFGLLPPVAAQPAAGLPPSQQQQQQPMWVGGDAAPGAIGAGAGGDAGRGPAVTRAAALKVPNMYALLAERQARADDGGAAA